MSGQDAFMARAREMGACHNCCYVRHAQVVEREHPDCYRLIIAAMEERYGHIPHDGSLRLALYRDGVR